MLHRTFCVLGSALFQKTALSVKTVAPEEDRTLDLRIAGCSLSYNSMRPALYRLSHGSLYITDLKGALIRAPIGSRLTCSADSNSVAEHPPYTHPRTRSSPLHPSRHIHRSYSSGLIVAPMPARKRPPSETLLPLRAAKHPRLAEPHANERQTFADNVDGASYLVQVGMKILKLGYEKTIRSLFPAQGA